MNYWLSILNVFEKFVYDIGKFWNWFSSPLDIINVSPLMIFSFGGIMVLIGIYLIKLIV